VRYQTALCSDDDETPRFLRFLALQGKPAGLTDWRDHEIARQKQRFRESGPWPRGPSVKPVNGLNSRIDPSEPRRAASAIAPHADSV